MQLSRLSQWFAVAVALAIASPSAGAETVSATTLTIEAKIPFEVTRGLKLYHDSMIVAGLGSVWFFINPELWRIDTGDNSVIKIAIPGIMGPIRGGAFNDDAIWIADTGTNTIFKISTETNSVVATMHARMVSRDSAIALGAGSLWVVTAENSEGMLTRFAAATGDVQATIDLPAPSAGGVIYAFDAAWVIGTTNGEVYRIDPATNAVTSTTKIHGVPHAALASNGSLWVNCRQEAVIDRIDPASGTVIATIETGLQGPEALLEGGAYLWLVTPANVFTQIDPRTNTILRGYDGNDMDPKPGASASWADGSIWSVAATGYFAKDGVIYRFRSPE